VLVWFQHFQGTIFLFLSAEANGSPFFSSRWSLLSITEVRAANKMYTVLAEESPTMCLKKKELCSQREPLTLGMQLNIIVRGCT